MTQATCSPLLQFFVQVVCWPGGKALSPYPGRNVSAPMNFQPFHYLEAQDKNIVFELFKSSRILIFIEEAFRKWGNIPLGDLVKSYVGWTSCKGSEAKYVPV